MMAMCWLNRACPHISKDGGRCGGSLYYGTDKKPGYKGNVHLAKCLNCSRMVRVTTIRQPITVEAAR